ncbi:LuxR C-terminal-related transcriptional regulator [Dactylosporangium sp. NBC_01737]|uniref:helix-turn-helix transcriptional regulator n=1 Tax=Dactylosporangium sp. NBC_01737 TaxID=2975959 RepID=UPI002E0F7ADE|nr:LuxR C-terminal-related transcriptional regulator [Dactylosporangium sp. NBC_01737]
MTARDHRLVGRIEELAAVRRSLSAGTGSGALLTGEPGVGKSWLLGAALDQLEGDGFGIVRVSATPSWQDVPFGSVPGFAPPDDSDLAGAFQHVRGRFTTGCPTGPMVIGIDDVNWLDDASTALLERLLADRLVKVLATVRSNAVNSRVVALVRRAGALDRVDVPPLDRAGHDDLVAAVLGGPVSGLTLDALWRITLGNPLFVRETLRAAAAEGTLVAQEGVWTWRPSGRAIPRLYEAVDLTVGILSDEEAAALAYVAYAEPLRLAVLDRLVAPAVAEQLEDRGVIKLVDTGGVFVRLGHPLFGEAIRTRTKPLRRRRLLRELVEAMQDDVVSVEDRIRVMSWRCEAGLPVDLGDVLAAADAALDRGGASLAERLARGIPGPMGAWYLGRTQVALGRPQDAEVSLATAYTQLDAPLLRARAAALRALNLFWGLRQPDVALSLLEEAHRDLPDEVHAEMLVAEAGIAVFYKADINAAATVVAAWEKPPQEPLLAGALTPLLPFVLVYAGAPRQAASELAGGVSPQPSWPTMRAATQACHIHALVMCGQLEEAALLAERYYEDAVAHGSPDGVGLLAMMVGVCHGEQGRVEQAAKWTSEAFALTDAHTLFPIRANILGMQAWWAAHQGHVERATRALAAIDDLLPSADSRSGDYAQLARALLLASTDQPAIAVKILRDLAEQFIGTGVVGSAMEALHLWSRVEPSAEAAAEVRRVADMSDSPLFSWYADYAAALAGADRGRLEALSLDWEQRNYTVLALEAAVRARQACPDSDQRAAGRLTRRIAELRDRCGGHWPAWLVEPVAVSGLTRREQGVCALAAAGLSNTEISVRLVLSVRTVENHLQRAYDKLGIRQRSQLAQVLYVTDPNPTPQ